MSGTEDGAQRAEEGFAAYDFGADERYREYATSTEIMGQVTAEEAEVRLKRRYYRLKVDENLRKDAPPPSLSEERARATGGNEAEGANAGASATSQQSTTSTSGTRATTPTAGRPAVLKKILDKSQIRLVLNIGTFLLCVAAVVSGAKDGISADTRVARAHLMAVLTFLLSLFTTAGPPKLSMEYMQAVARLDDLHYTNFCFLFYEQPQIQLSLLPVAIFSAFNSARLFRAFAAAERPQLLQAFGLGARIDQLLRYQQDALQVVANCEILLIISIVINLMSRSWSSRAGLSSSTNFWPTVLRLMLPIRYGQFLYYRYQASAYSRHAWSRLDATLEGIMSKYVPSALPYYRRFTATVLRIVQRSSVTTQ